jgi:predicted aconitase with swiveling domain
LSKRPGASVVRIAGRAVRPGHAVGVALVSTEPIGFLGGVDGDTGIVVEPGHPLEGESVAGRILVFPTGKGSTVGSYTLYRLARNGAAPAAIVNREADPVVAVGAIIADIPMVDQVDIAQLRTGDVMEVDGAEITLNRDQEDVAHRGSS